ncbi:hypothetical protein MAR_031543 [Mya arenaria]|uniref:Uncharacterized protein n=1 Tax=Mya arenaria TaxID=6604 RepID=A0ABY7F6F0_MYAAR|nr:hypothetical protein MAR_031543 [Mya arenaria]
MFIGVTSQISISKYQVPDLNFHGATFISLIPNDHLFVSRRSLPLRNTIITVSAEFATSTSTTAIDTKYFGGMVAHINI